MPTIQRPSWPVIAALMIFLVVIGGFIPQIFASSQGTEIETVHQTEGESVVLRAPLEATLLTVDQNPGRVNVTIVDTETGDFAATGVLNEGENTTVQLRGNDVTVSYLTAIDNNEATLSYEYPVFYEWNNTAVAFVGVIGVIILLLFLYMIFILIQPEDES